MTDSHQSTVEPAPGSVIALVMDLVDSPWPQQPDGMSAWIDELCSRLDRSGLHDVSAQLLLRAGAIRHVGVMLWQETDGLQVEAAYRALVRGLTERLGQPSQTRRHEAVGSSTAWRTVTHLIELYHHSGFPPTPQGGAGGTMVQLGLSPRQP